MLNKIALTASLVAVLTLAGTAAAGNNGASNKSSSSISVVMLTQASSTGAAASGPRWGDQVTFNVSTNQTTQPSVVANCYQNGSLVYTQFGFFYPAPQSPSFTLQSYAWTSGAAECTAQLYAVSPKKGTSTTLATTSFHVDG